ncbi:MAG: hypothetical protein HYV38_00350 [Candidatus Levybacteria bacterium]|nr:hypothetical protein [Candidatus Saccharibacteria bacterium]MBI2420523.1 hypothetical protein [Candidatus Levybacteria bacterium]
MQEESTPTKNKNNETLYLFFACLVLASIIFGYILLVTYILGAILSASDIHLDWHFILSFTDSLKWPLLIVFLALLFRKKVPGWAGSLASKIKRVVLKFGGGEASVEFEEIEKKQENPEPPDSPPEIQYEVSSVQEDDHARAAEFWKEMYNFERLYGISFGSQLSVLFYINEQNGADLPSLKKFLDKHVSETGGRVYTNITEFLKFLINAGFIIWNQEELKYKITDRGKKFLNYLIIQNYSLDRPG